MYLSHVFTPQTTSYMLLGLMHQRREGVVCRGFKRRKIDMVILKTQYHPTLMTLEGKTVFTRLATRSISIYEEMILLLYTERYDDYSLPGGGLEPNEDKIQGMIRELEEETGAQGIKNIKEFGIYEEYRPWYKSDFDVQHILSYCYTCDVDHELGNSRLESYELKNGMRAVWINIYDAIKHNENTMASSEKKGMSIERETFLLRLIVDTQLDHSTSAASD